MTTASRLRTLARRTMLTFAAITAVAAVVTPASAQDEKPIKIGILAPYTGVFASFGPKTIEAPIRLYLDQKGSTLAGHPVELIIADDQSKPDVEVEKARELVENQGVKIIVGLVNSAGALAVRDYLDEHKVLTLITVAGAKELTQDRKSDAIFRLSWANGQAEAAGAVLAETAGVTSMVGIGADYVAARQLMEPLMQYFQDLGGKVPMALWSPLGTADYSSYLAQIGTVIDDVDAVSPMLFGADGVRFFTQYKEFGYEKPLYVFGDVAEQTVFLDQVGDTAIGTKAYWNYSPYLDNDVNNAFREAYYKAYSRLPGAFSFHSWAAMQFLETALDAVGGDADDFEGLKTALESTTIQSPAGPLSFDPDHNVVHNIYLNEVKKGPDGIVAQMPIGPMITNVDQYQTVEQAQANLVNAKP